jgi:hypothetical protein
MLEIEYLPEAKLQFGSFFEHEDSKTGLAEFGPFGKNVAGLHPSAIKLGFIGTRETIAGAREWIEELRSPIESENQKTVGNSAKKEDTSQTLFGAGILDDEPPQDESFVRVFKILNRDFIGFSSDTPFKCAFQVNDRWDRTLQPDEIKAKLKIEDKQKRIWELVNLFDDQIKSLAQIKPSPDIIILALTPQMVDEAHAVQVTGNFYLNFRRAIKARAMKWGIPIAGSGPVGHIRKTTRR